MFRRSRQSSQVFKDLRHNHSSCYNDTRLIMASIAETCSEWDSVV
jgi:hypothetical protein